MPENVIVWHIDTVPDLAACRTEADNSSMLSGGCRGKRMLIRAQIAL